MRSPTAQRPDASLDTISPARTSAQVSRFSGWMHANKFAVIAAVVGMIDLGLIAGRHRGRRLMCASRLTGRGRRRADAATRLSLARGRGGSVAVPNPAGPGTAVIALWTSLRFRDGRAKFAVAYCDVPATSRTI